MNRLKRRLGDPAELAPPRSVRPRFVDRLTDTRTSVDVVGTSDRPIDLTIDDEDEDDDACSDPSTANSTSSSCSSSTSTCPCSSDCGDTDNNDDDSDNDTTPSSPPVLTPEELEAILFPAKARREAKCRATIESLSARPLPGRMVHPLPPRPLPARTRSRGRGRGRRQRPRPSPSLPIDDDDDDCDSEEEWRRDPPVIVGGGIILDDSETLGFDLGRTTPVVLAATESSCDEPVPVGPSPEERNSADVSAQSTSWRAEGSASDGSTDLKRTDVIPIGEGSEAPSDEVEGFLSALEAVISGTNS